MGWCPHCRQGYDEDNETQPCCPSCGHPITCGEGCSDYASSEGDYDAGEALMDQEHDALNVEDEAAEEDGCDEEDR